MKTHTNWLYSKAFMKAACLLSSMSAVPLMVEADTLNTAVEIVQQSMVVKGSVVDANGYPIIGANVMEKGTTNGTITDLDGNFSLNVSSKAVLVISYIGYKSQEVTVDKSNRKSLKISLKEDTELIDEVVVVGYGVVKKSDVTGALTKVSEKQIKERPVQNALQDTYITYTSIIP